MSGRIAFSDGTACWGVACLMRRPSRPPFAATDVAWIAPHTVRDHVKSIFSKVEVRSRGELVARLFTDHYAERHAASLGAGHHGQQVRHHG